MVYTPETKNALIIIVFTVILSILITLTGCSAQMKDQRTPVQVLILPKFALDEMAGGFPGEAQYFFEEYLVGGDAYDIDGCPESNKLYYKNGIPNFKGWLE